MNNILNHGNTPISFQNQSKQQMIQSRKNQNQGIFNRPHPNNKFSLQQLYKHQLDNFIYDKEIQKNKQRQKEQKQKIQYQQKVKQSMQNQKLKDLAYKNEQQHNKQTYISPFNQKQLLKQSHIQRSIEDQQKKNANWQYQLRKRQIQKKNQYKQELMRQMQERKRKEEQNKQNLLKQNQYYRKNFNVPSQIASYQRQKRRQDMDKYRQDLDRVLNQKMSRSRHNSQSQTRNLVYSEEFHNPLINPLPYNIQNPYILREMQKDQSHSSANRQEQSHKNQSYFARKGNNIFN